MISYKVSLVLCFKQLLNYLVLFHWWNVTFAYSSGWNRKKIYLCHQDHFCWCSLLCFLAYLACSLAGLSLLVLSNRKKAQREKRNLPFKTLRRDSVLGKVIDDFHTFNDFKANIRFHAKNVDEDVFVHRLQNSPYFCVFKYARAVKQIGLERGWKQRASPMGVWGSRASCA